MASAKQKRRVQTKDAFPSFIKQLVERLRKDVISFRQTNTDRPLVSKQERVRKSSFSTQAYSEMKRPVEAVGSI
jgi:hypothetical protein